METVLTVLIVLNMTKPVLFVLIRTTISSYFCWNIQSQVAVTVTKRAWHTPRAVDVNQIRTPSLIMPTK